MKYRLTKEQKNKLKLLAKQLPVTFYQANCISITSTDKVIANDRIDKSKVVGMLPGGIARLEKAEEFRVNHTNRIITAYESGGMNAVESYCKEVMELVLQTVEPVAIKSNLI